MKNKARHYAKKTSKKKRRTLRKNVLLEAPTLAELDHKIMQLETLGYQPASHVNSTYDQWFQNHSIMVTRKKYQKRK